MCMIWVLMYDVDFVDYMRKVLLNINKVVSSYYVDILRGCKGLWSHDRFTKYVWGYGALHVIALLDLDWGHELGLIRFYVK